MARVRILGGGAIIGAVVVIAIVFALSGSDYTVVARFVSASQVVKGKEVKVSGEPVGKVREVRLTGDGLAELTLSIDADGYHPLREGTRAIVRPASLSGVANRYNAYLPPTSSPDPQAEVLPSFDCANSGEQGPTNRPGCKVAGPIPFGGLSQRFPQVREAGPGGVLP